MSRIIVKNLPKKISDRKLLKIFEAEGYVTDVNLKYNKDGVFRQFAFIGYKTNEEATAAKNHFNNSYIGISKIQVEMCKALDDADKPRARSKYSTNLLDVNNQDAESLKVVESENNKKHKKKLKESQDRNEKSKVEDLPKEVENKREEQVAAIAETGRIFVRNLCFNVTEEELRTLFSKYGPIAELHIPVDHYTKEHVGYAFVTYVLPENAVKAFAELDGFDFQGRVMHLTASKPKPEIRNSTNKSSFKDKKNAKLNTLCKRNVTGIKRKKVQSKEQTGTEILVRNIPFEASRKEIKQLFQEYGDLKAVRLPMKPSGDGGHRGFGFVDFVTKTAAKRAFEMLCHSTHLLGRRLVLEWANTDTDDVSEQRNKTARDFYSGHAEKRVKKAKLMEDVLLSSTAPTED